MGSLPEEHSAWIRSASSADTGRIADVLYESFVQYRSSYSTKAFEATVASRPEIETRFKEGPVWVAVVKNEIVGTVSAVPGEAALYVRSLAIIPRSRGLGIGRKLLQQTEEFAIRNRFGHLVLSTTPFLIEAIQLYERYGFKRTEDGPTDRLGTPIFTMKKTLDC